MNAEMARILFPKIMPRLISIQMTNLALPFAVWAAATDAYLKTIKEVIR